jgi:hypothetical protein
VKRSLSREVDKISKALVAKFEPGRDYSTMAGRRAWLQDLIDACPTDGRELGEHKALRIREIEIT